MERCAHLQKVGLLEARPETISDALASAYDAVARMYASGEVTSAGDVLAMNFLLDRSAKGWARHLASLKSEVNDCETSDAMVATGALSGDFTWRCDHGRLKGSLLLAPTDPPGIQALSLARATP